MPDRSVVLAIALTLLVPLAAAAPIRYVGEGWGTKESNIPTPLWPDCAAAHVEVVIHQVGGKWYPHSHREEFADPGACPEVGIHSAVASTRFVEVEGDPETGFRMWSSNACYDSEVTIGPVGPASRWTWYNINRCEARGSWINATIAFTRAG